MTAIHIAHDCAFCAPAPAQIIAACPLTFTLRDAFPVSPGHTLVVPRRHFADLFEATDAEIAAIWAALRQAAGELAADTAESPRPAGFNVGVNVGSAAGQTVMHLHWHLIPRYPGDQPDPRGGIRRIFPERADYWTVRPT